MNRRLSSASAKRAASLALLATALGLAPLPAAQAPRPPALPAEDQKFINAPVWYLNYTISLRIHGTTANAFGASRTESRDRMTSGRMILGVRSSGPSLSVVANPALMAITAAGQIDALVANYANWLHGPPEETGRRLTESQQEARVARVRESNLKAVERHIWSYTATGGVNGGTDRGAAHGSGTVLHTGEPALEFNAEAREWRLLFDVLAFVDSAGSVQSFVGTDEKNVGTIHYVRQAIKTGIRSGFQPVSSPQPRSAGLFSRARCRPTSAPSRTRPSTR